MSNTAPSRADPVVVFPFGRWCPAVPNAGMSIWYIDEFVQDYSIFSVLAIEILQFSLQNKIWNLPDRSTILPKFIYDKEGKFAGPTQISPVRVRGPALILKTGSLMLSHWYTHWKSPIEMNCSRCLCQSKASCIHHDNLDSDPWATRR